jgi:hypothetical protein
MTHINQDPIARAILGYFLRNPKAVDNLEGVARWRLLDETVHQHVDKTSEALRWLVQRGLLREIPTAVGPIFGLNPDKCVEAKQFLSAAEAARPPGEVKCPK